MLQLGLTIPLQRRQQIKALPYGQPLDRRFCWDLHGISLHGRDCLLAVHSSSRYTFTLFDLSPTDRADLAGCFLHGLRESLDAADIPAPLYEEVLRHASAPILTKTHGRREVAFLNRAWEDILRLDHTIDPSDQCQPLLDSAVNALLRRCAGHAGPGRADERLRLDLAQTIEPMRRG